MEKEIDLTIGRKSLRLLKIYKKTNSNCFAFITAFNPNGQLTDLEINLCKQNDLIKTIMDMGYKYFEGYSTDEAEAWPRENSILTRCKTGI